MSNYRHGHGFRVTRVHSGELLMALMRDDPPALVVLDLGLPSKHGLSIARQLREHRRCGLVLEDCAVWYSYPRGGFGRCPLLISDEVQQP